jgi:hypothetical protein
VKRPQYVIPDLDGLYDEAPVPPDAYPGWSVEASQDLASLHDVNLHAATNAMADLMQEEIDHEIMERIRAEGLPNTPYAAPAEPIEIRLETVQLTSKMGVRKLR